MGTALKTFEIAYGRADRILKMATALTDDRTRALRSDRAENVKRIMHWPQSHVIDRAESRDLLIVVKDGSTLTRKDFCHQSTDDLVRAALVMAVSALDAYFHAKILQWVIAHSRKASKDSALMRQQITVGDFVRGLGMKYGNAALRAALDRKLSFQSLQTPDSIADVVKLIGVTEFWNSVATHVGLQPNYVKKRLSEIVNRRNQIAHEGDLSQSKKARNKPRDITRKYVRDALDFVHTLVHSANEVIDAKKVV